MSPAYPIVSNIFFFFNQRFYCFTIYWNKTRRIQTSLVASVQLFKGNNYLCISLVCTQFCTYWRVNCKSYVFCYYNPGVVRIFVTFIFECFTSPVCCHKKCLSLFIPRWCACVCSSSAEWFTFYDNGKMFKFCYI